MAISGVVLGAMLGVVLLLVVSTCVAFPLDKLFNPVNHTRYTLLSMMLESFRVPLIFYPMIFIGGCLGALTVCLLLNAQHKTLSPSELWFCCIVLLGLTVLWRCLLFYPMLQPLVSRVTSIPPFKVVLMWAYCFAHPALLWSLCLSRWSYVLNKQHPSIIT
ncbi:MAG: hypothetical protein JOZ57_07365 [Abitibacteriaceae bacterium]|nr:hypothetical protein [Abditibacteriaceae bacterium]